MQNDIKSVHRIVQLNNKKKKLSFFIRGIAASGESAFRCDFTVEHHLI